MFYRFIFVLSATVVPVIIKYWIQQNHRKRLEKLKAKNLELDSFYYHPLFWFVSNVNCRSHFITERECANSNCSVKSFRKILNLLSSSQYSISLCMYHMTLRQISVELFKAKDRGVKVRLITDYVTSTMDHSKMQYLKKQGFEVRTPPEKGPLMHHKYCLIDAEDPKLQKLFLGSLNFTLQACVANFEFVVITNNKKIIKSYHDEFEFLWETFGR